MGDQFISCDWGTSSFRLRLVAVNGKKVLAEIFSDQGIAGTYAIWKVQEGTDRLLFYSDFILRQIKLLEMQNGNHLGDLTVIISGMASASIGMSEMPYKSIPVKVEDDYLPVQVINPVTIYSPRIIIISGLSCGNDVMRGEETMLAGCDFGDMAGKQLFIFPGTHSKHVEVANGMIENFKTYMTGEVFELLSTKSILAVSVEKNAPESQNNNAFLRGVKEAVDTNLLNNIFHVRTGELLNGITKKDNYHYLSGLLIGEELKNISQADYSSITIVSTEKFFNVYTEAFIALGYKGKLRQQNADDALIKGQSLIYNKYL